MFHLGRREFGVQVPTVLKSMGIQDIRATPRKPAPVKGVINLRGQAIGIVVNGAAEALNLAAAYMEDTPDFGDGTATLDSLGLAKIKGKVKIRLGIGPKLKERGSGCILEQSES